MPGTRVEGIFEELKKFLSPRRIWQKALIPKHDLLKSFATPTIKVNIAQKKFSHPFYNFSIVFVPLTSNKKNSEEFSSFKLCLKMIF